MTHVGNYWNRGGAATAMVRVHEAIGVASKENEVCSRIQVALSEEQFPDQSGQRTSSWSRLHGPNPLESRMRKSLGRRISRAIGSVVSLPPSFPTGLGKILNRDNSDVINLHWLGGGTLSLSEIGRLCKPVVWRLPDLWPAGSVEHYPSPEMIASHYRWNGSELPFDVSLVLRWFWRQKLKHLSFPYVAVCPSEWTREFATQSPLFRQVNCEVIPNPLDTDFWSPSPSGNSESVVGGRVKKSLKLLFGAVGGTRDPRKGWDFFRDALGEVSANHPEISLEVEVFGQNGSNERIHGFPVKFLGMLDEAGLREAYRRADVFVATPKQESFGQTVTEAQSCGTPVLGSEVGGLKDSVAHGVSGYLVGFGNVHELAGQISEFGLSPLKARNLGLSARRRALNLWSYEVVGRKYIDLYKRVARNRGLYNR